MIIRALLYRQTLSLRRVYHFGVASDPYYILGVDKNAEFADIKKAFYKLASEYHPDKTEQDKEAGKKFILVKQAYETIKMQKGITKPKGFIYDDEVSSMRPDPSRFDTDDQENVNRQTDYRMYQERAQSSEEYEQFRGTFKTINDINDIKIRVQDGQMKDSSARFKLEELRAKITSITGNGAAYFIVITLGVLFYYNMEGKAMDKRQEKQITEGLNHQKSSQKERKILGKQEEQSQKFVESMKNNAEMKEFIKQRERAQLSTGLSSELKRREVISEEFEGV